MAWDAIAEVLEIQADLSRLSTGTAFAVSPYLALTAFHVIGDRETGAIRINPIVLRFLWRRGKQADFYECDACYHDGDATLDFAVLELKRQLPDELRPLALTSEASAQERFVSRGYPVLDGTDFASISGEIVDLDGSIFERVLAIALYSPQAGAGMPLGGMSGAPILVGSGVKRAAIGLIRWNPTRPENPTLSVGGTVYACPVAAIAGALSSFNISLIHRHPVADLVLRYPFPTVAETDCYELLGVWPTKYVDIYRAKGAYPPYVRREGEKDTKLVEDLQCKSFVLLLGPSASGKSRVAYEGLLRADPGAVLIVPRRPEDLIRLVNELGNWTDRPKRCVLWLDNLERFFKAGTLDTERVQSVRRLGVQIVATIRDTVYGDWSEDPDITAGGRGLFEDICEHQLSGDMEGGEEQRARELYPDLPLSGGLGESFVASRRLKRRYETAPPPLKAVVRAAQDWRRTGCDKPISRKELFTLFKAHISKLAPLRDLNSDAALFQSALQAACKPVAKYSALLLPDLKNSQEQYFSMPHYVIAFVENDKYPMENKAWDVVLERLRAATDVTTFGISEFLACADAASRQQRNDIVEIVLRIGLGIHPDADALSRWLNTRLAFQEAVFVSPVDGLRVYRIVSMRWRVPSFEGWRLGDGHWHARGTPVIYCAESIPAALAEFSLGRVANRHREEYQYLELRIPQAASILTISNADFQTMLGKEGSLQRRAFVRDWTASGASLVLAVPSAKITGSTTFLINPEHHDFAKISIYSQGPLQTE